MPETEAAAEYVQIDTLVPWAKNPRNNDAAAKEVARSIKRFGFGAPLLARKADRMVIAGHTRLKAAQLLGLDVVPVRFLDLSPTDAQLLALADNRTGELAEWDDKGLREVLLDLKEQEIDLDGLGWDLGELNDLMDPPSSIYTAKVESPIYTPKGERPEVRDLFDTSKTEELSARIVKAELPPDVRDFLLSAAKRHTSFRYDRIAEWYAHASPEVQELMEESALVIIDFRKAVELGFVRLNEALADAYRDEHDED